MEDRELLREYTERQSEAAFTELVSRHVNLVYSTALRVVGESQLAQDVAQSVFIQLARKARSIREGNAPSANSTVFSGANNATVYCLPGTAGWNPQVQRSGANFGVRANRFGFTITGTSGLAIVVQARTNLAHGPWFPLSTNTLAGGSSYFSDPQWTNYPSRFYRLWGLTFAGRPAVLWNPQVQMSGASFGVRTNRFGFNITGTTNIPIVVEACANLASASWTSLRTCTITNGSIYFSDAAWTNYPRCFYRLRSP